MRERRVYTSSLTIEDINSVSGIVYSSPIKIGKYYKFKLKLKSSSIQCNTLYKSIISTAKGIIEVSLPANIVEAAFPGKLYSLSTVGCYTFVEKGEWFEFSGAWKKKDNIFVAEDAHFLKHTQGIYGSILNKRAICRLHFRRILYSWGKAGSVILALLSGIREYVDEKDIVLFRKAGLSHLLALSGMHLAFFSNFSGIIFYEILGKKYEKIASFIAVFLFIFFAGFTPSLLRAFLCYVIVYVAKICYLRNYNMLEVLSLSFLIHCIIAPSDIFSIAFMLSYSALAGILIFSDSLNKYFVKAIPPVLSSLLATSTSAQVFTIPITFFLFGTFTPIGIISSIIISPLLSIFLIIAIFAIFTSLLIPYSSIFFCCILNIFYDILLNIVNLFVF